MNKSAKGRYGLWLLLPGILWSAPQGQPVIHLVVESSLRVSRAAGTNYSFGAEEKIKAFLTGGGLTVVASSGGHDAALSVEIQCTPLSENYSTFGFGSATEYFTGARLEGTLLLELRNRPAIEKQFTGLVPIPSRLVGGSGPRQPSDAPFGKAFEESDFNEKLSDAMGEAFNSQILFEFWIRKMPLPLARNALAKIGTAAIGPLLSNSRTNAISREAMSDLLTGIGHTDALVPFLRDPDVKVRWCVVDAVGRLLLPSSEAHLANALGDHDASVREIAAYHLRRWPAASEPLRGALKDSSPLVRKTAAASLGAAQDKNAVAALEEVLKNDKDAAVRKTAADSLGEVGDKRAVVALEGALKADKDAVVRLSALDAIAKLGTPEILTAALGDSDAKIRERAVVALGRSESQRSIGPLVDAMQGQTISFRRIVAEALKRITKQDFGLDAQAWARWWDAQPKQ
jgi:HEAT repeat protein